MLKVNTEIQAAKLLQSTCNAKAEQLTQIQMDPFESTAQFNSDLYQIFEVWSGEGFKVEAFGKFKSYSFEAIVKNQMIPDLNNEPALLAQVSGPRDVLARWVDNHPEVPDLKSWASLQSVPSKIFASCNTKADLASAVTVAATDKKEATRFVRAVQKSAKDLEKQLDKAVKDLEKLQAQEQQQETAAAENATARAALPAVPAAAQQKARAADLAIFGSDSKDLADVACIGIEDMEQWNGAFILEQLKAKIQGEENLPYVIQSHAALKTVQDNAGCAGAMGTFMANFISSQEYLSEGGRAVQALANSSVSAQVLRAAVVTVNVKDPVVEVTEDLVKALLKDARQQGPHKL